jgi:NAD(P)-dependent dehydrogenase (short-subunit alcohol dehydrogenase family)
MAEAVRWGERGARVNTISPGIIMTPLARDELTGPRGEGYQRMITLSAAGRAGTPDEVGTLAALLMGPDGGFITGSDFLMDGGVTAAYHYGALAPKWQRKTKRALGDKAVLRTDVTKREEVAQLIDHAVKAHGRIDVLINNAGLMPHSPLERAKVEDWERMIDVNIKGVLYGIAAALPHKKFRAKVFD